MPSTIPSSMSPITDCCGDRTRTMAGLLGLMLLTGCSAAYWAADADRDVANVLETKSREALDARGEQVQRPAAERPGPAEEASPAEAGAGFRDEQVEVEAGATAEPVMRLSMDLEEALLTAVVSAREIITRRESVYLQGLGLTLVRFDFGPQVNSTLRYLYSDSEVGSANHLRSADIGASQILSTGGIFSVNSLFTRNHGLGPDGNTSNTSAVAFRLSQPLLRGAGYEASHESLTQGERDMLYEVRQFELFRQDFAISIARDFFDLVRQRDQLGNEEQNYKDSVFDREKAEALRTLDRNRDEDVFLARRREIDAETRMLNARTDLQLGLDSFRIRLGLSKSVELEIVEEKPPFELVRLDADSAVAVALNNRLDLVNERERLEDSERRVRIAKNGLLPDVEFDLTYGLDGESDSVRKADPKDWSILAGLRVDVPIQRTPERNSYRASLIASDRTRRNYELLLEDTESEVRDALRQLRNTEQQIDLQKQQIGQERRAVAVTELRFESGDVDARDMLDARQALVLAENELIRLQVDHFIERLRLYRDLGLLFIDPNGMWST